MGRWRQVIDRVGDARFVTTNWSLVLRAGASSDASSDASSSSSSSASSSQAREAMAELCARYWYPLYAYVRRKGCEPEEAEDLTQGFFARMLEHNGLAAARADKGRFRTFLLSSLQHYVCNEWARERAAKRGGRLRIVPIDVPGAEARYSHEPVDGNSPESIFERRWAIAVLEQALAALRAQYSAAGKEELFDTLKVFLMRDGTVVPQSAIAATLGVSEGAVKVAVHRLRQRFRAAMEQAIADTVSSPVEVEEEIRALFRALGP
jgi:RNA polymerase sigma-70 factor (ECF subfamily)